MKTIRPFGTRDLTLILATALGISISVGFASPAFAEPVIVNPDGKVTYLGTLGGPYVNSDLKLIQFFIKQRLKIDTPLFHSHTTYAPGAVSRLLFTIPAAH